MLTITTHSSIIFVLVHLRLQQEWNMTLLKDAGRLAYLHLLQAVFFRWKDAQNVSEKWLLKWHYLLPRIEIPKPWHELSAALYNGSFDEPLFPVFIKGAPELRPLSDSLIVPPTCPNALIECLNALQLPYMKAQPHTLQALKTVVKTAGSCVLTPSHMRYRLKRMDPGFIQQVLSSTLIHDLFIYCIADWSAATMTKELLRGLVNVPLLVFADGTVGRFSMKNSRAKCCFVLQGSNERNLRTLVPGRILASFYSKPSVQWLVSVSTDLDALNMQWLTPLGWISLLESAFHMFGLPDHIATHQRAEVSLTNLLIPHISQRHITKSSSPSPVTTHSKSDKAESISFKDWLQQMWLVLEASFESNNFEQTETVHHISTNELTEMKYNSSQFNLDARVIESFFSKLEEIAVPVIPCDDGNARALQKRPTPLILAFPENISNSVINAASTLGCIRPIGSALSTLGKLIRVYQNFGNDEWNSPYFHSTDVNGLANVFLDLVISKKLRSKEICEQTCCKLQSLYYLKNTREEVDDELYMAKLTATTFDEIGINTFVRLELLTLCAAEQQSLTKAGIVAWKMLPIYPIANKSAYILPLHPDKCSVASINDNKKDLNGVASDLENKSKSLRVDCSASFEPHKDDSVCEASLYSQMEGFQSECNIVSNEQRPQPKLPPKVTSVETLVETLELTTYDSSYFKPGVNDELRCVSPDNIDTTFLSTCDDRYIIAPNSDIFNLFQKLDFKFVTMRTLTTNIIQSTYNTATVQQQLSILKCLFVHDHFFLRDEINHLLNGKMFPTAVSSADVSYEHSTSSSNTDATLQQQRLRRKITDLHDPATANVALSLLGSSAFYHQDLEPYKKKLFDLGLKKKIDYRTIIMTCRLIHEENSKNITGDAHRVAGLLRVKLPINDNISLAFPRETVLLNVLQKKANSLLMQAEHAGERDAFIDAIRSCEFLPVLAFPPLAPLTWRGQGSELVNSAAKSSVLNMEEGKRYEEVSLLSCRKPKDCRDRYDAWTMGSFYFISAVHINPNLYPLLGWNENPTSDQISQQLESLHEFTKFYQWRSVLDQVSYLPNEREPANSTYSFFINDKHILACLSRACLRLYSFLQQMENVPQSILEKPIWTGFGFVHRHRLYSGQQPNMEPYLYSVKTIVKSLCDTKLIIDDRLCPPCLFSQGTNSHLSAANLQELFLIGPPNVLTWKLGLDSMYATEQNIFFDVAVLLWKIKNGCFSSAAHRAWQTKSVVPLEERDRTLAIKMINSAVDECEDDSRLPSDLPILCEDGCLYPCTSLVYIENKHEIPKNTNGNASNTVKYMDDILLPKVKKLDILSLQELLQATSTVREMKNFVSLFEPNRAGKPIFPVLFDILEAIDSVTKSSSVDIFLDFTVYPISSLLDPNLVHLQNSPSLVFEVKSQMDIKKLESMIQPWLHPTDDINPPIKGKGIWSAFLISNGFTVLSGSFLHMIGPLDTSWCSGGGWYHCCESSITLKHRVFDFKAYPALLSQFGDQFEPFLSYIPCECETFRTSRKMQPFDGAIIRIPLCSNHEDAMSWFSALERNCPILLCKFSFVNRISAYILKNEQRLLMFTVSSVLSHADRQNRRNFRGNYLKLGVVQTDSRDMSTKLSGILTTMLGKRHSNNPSTIYSVRIEIVSNMRSFFMSGADWQWTKLDELVLRSQENMGHKLSNEKPPQLEMPKITRTVQSWIVNETCAFHETEHLVKGTFTKGFSFIPYVAISLLVRDSRDHTAVKTTIEPSTTQLQNNFQLYESRLSQAALVTESNVCIAVPIPIAIFGAFNAYNLADLSPPQSHINITPATITRKLNSVLIKVAFRMYVKLLDKLSKEVVAFSTNPQLFYALWPRSTQTTSCTDVPFDFMISHLHETSDYLEELVTECHHDLAQRELYFQSSGKRRLFKHSVIMPLDLTAPLSDFLGSQFNTSVKLPFDLAVQLQSSMKGKYAMNVSPIIYNMMPPLMYAY